MKWTPDIIDFIRENRGWPVKKLAEHFEVTPEVMQKAINYAMQKGTLEKKARPSRHKPKNKVIQIPTKVQDFTNGHWVRIDGKTHVFRRSA